MKKKAKRFKEESAMALLLLREKLGLKRHRKMTPRDEEKRKILLRLNLKRIAEKEISDYIQIGFRRRRIRIE